MQVHGAAVFAIVWSSCLVLLLLMMIIIIIIIIIIMIARAEVSSLSSTGWRSLHS